MGVEDRFMADSGRYPTDLTDLQWEVVKPLLWSRPRGPGGRPPEYDRRRIVDAILYVNRTGCAWRMLPKDFPPWRRVYDYFARWRDDGTTRRMHDALRRQVREQEGRGAEPTAGSIDSQSVKGADTVGRESRGYDAGKKINGRKRHIGVDTIGLLIVVMVTAASMQDRDGGRHLVTRMALTTPTLRLVWADGGYAGKLIDFAHTFWRVTIQIVNKLAGQTGFHVLPRRWVVERTFSWMMRQRRLCRDYERLPQTHEAFAHWAMISVMLNRLQRPPGRRPWAPKEAA